MTLTIAFSQLNPTVGDVAGNAALVRRARDEAAAQGADLVVFSELVLVGYPPEDLVLRPALVEAAAGALCALGRATEDLVVRPGVVEAAAAALHDLERESAAPGSPGLVVTLPWKYNGQVHNAVALVTNGTSELRFKHELPNYGVFDEKRVFEPGPLPEPVTFRDARLGLPVCEDIWLDHVTTHLAKRGVQLMLVPHGSPFEVDKFEHSLDLARARVSETRVPLAYVNQVGGQDELVFDGGSFVMNADGTLACVMPFWREALVLTRWTLDGKSFRCEAEAHWSRQPRLDAIYNARRLALRDYVRKNHFPGVVLGMSGGIDSALTAAVAVDALGAAHVRGVRLPSRFTSRESQDDAAESGRLLGMRLDTVEIGSSVVAADTACAEV